MAVRPNNQQLRLVDEDDPYVGVGNPDLDPLVGNGYVEITASPKTMQVNPLGLIGHMSFPTQLACGRVAITTISEEEDED